LSSPDLTTIESSGTTSLLTDGTDYYLQIGDGPAVELSYDGAPVVAGQFGSWTLIGAEQTATGYEIAFNDPGSNQYMVWYTDSSGNMVSNATGYVSGTSAALESLETSFHQDLNGDGTIGVPVPSNATVIESSGAASLLAAGNIYLIQLHGGGAVELSLNGSPVTAGQFGAWTPIGAEQTATGYEVAWSVPGADQYWVWSTDSSGNYVSDSGVLSGTSAALQSFEASFQQDLNGDGTIGAPPSPVPTVIESFGSTSLAQSESNYLLEPNGGTAVKLSYGGAPVTAGQFGSWTPIGAEQTATGYEVAWRVPGADQYWVWNTDSSGNYVSDSGILSGTSAALESFETSFQQDLNGDGTIGAPLPAVIESFGSTSLAQSGSNYLLEPNGGAAVKLSYGGAPVTAGQFGSWTPIGAEQTATGYEVAWRVPGADQYWVWNTDSGGNYVSGATGVVSGASTALESLETSFQQDLNGDGTIGVPPPTVIESFGSTSLLKSGNSYLIEPNGGQTVQLSYGGAPVTAGQFGSWTPIGAEQTATGYEVAWSAPDADQYWVWSTDSNGNYVSDTGIVSGMSAALESLETSFQQDLNGDGTIGVPPPKVIESSGSMSLVTDWTNYLLEPNGGTAVKLSLGGTPVVVGQFGASTPIAAQQTATGYEVALADVGANQYTVWDTDSTGNVVSAPMSNVSGTSAALESMEVSFNDDLNGDGTIGVPVPSNATVIGQSGTASLLAAGNTYLIQPNGVAGGVALSYGGAPVAAGQFGAWIPIAAQQTATGYEVAWRVPGADQYWVWNTDSSGNYVSDASGIVSGTSAALESFETSFNEDLNNDGVIGAPSSSNQPLFAYQGTDANGAQLYDVTWNVQGSHPFAVRVLVPQHPSSDYAHSFLYALPVESGLSGQLLGDGIAQLANLDVEDKYNATIIEPIFPMFSWYADNPNDATVDYDTFVSAILPQWVDSNFSTTGDEKNLLIGFSKSGYGDLDLLFKNPTVFDAAAAFDFPADMQTYDGFGSSSANDYGTQANFQNNYEMDQSFLNTYKAPFTTQNRIWISEGPLFAGQVADFNSLLTSQGIMHTLSTTETNDPHSWTSGWLSTAVAGLYGLEKNLNSGASS
jgi:serralysin